jgi:dienelactone hydrolase
MNLDTWLERRVLLRNRLWEILGRPAEGVEPAGEVRGRFVWGDIAVEKIVYEVEPGQSVPALLYLPLNVQPPFPAIVISMGHGESKTTPGPLYAGPLYAKLGIACLCADPIGEEERNLVGRQGTRAHDLPEVSVRSRAAGRKVMGKMVWDLMMGLNYLQTRSNIDSDRPGCAGVSLGGVVASYLLALDERLSVAIPAGYFFSPADREVISSAGAHKDCTRIPIDEFMRFMTNGELLGLAAPHCAVLTANGDSDTIIDSIGLRAVHSLSEAVEDANRIYQLFETGDRIGMYVEPGGGHRHYYLAKPALLWAMRYLGPIRMSEVDLLHTPEVRFGDWADEHGVEIERRYNYNTEAHFRGLRTVDLEVDPLPVEERRCLRDEEIGTPRFTLEGWLEAAERQTRHDKS